MKKHRDDRQRRAHVMAGVNRSCSACTPAAVGPVGHPGPALPGSPSSSLTRQGALSPALVNQRRSGTSPRSTRTGAREKRWPYPQLWEWIRNNISVLTTDSLSWRNCCPSLSNKDLIFPPSLAGLLFFWYLFSYSNFAKTLQGVLQPLILIFSHWAWNSSPADNQHKTQIALKNLVLMWGLLVGLVGLFSPAFAWCCPTAIWRNPAIIAATILKL